MDDIRRLKKEHVWGTGRCAYCNGKGKVPVGTQSKVAVDETFLVTDLSRRMRKKLFDQDAEAIEMARAFDRTVDELMKQIMHLHGAGQSPEEIADFCIDSHFQDKKNYLHRKHKDELVAYIKKVIESKV